MKRSLPFFLMLFCLSYGAQLSGQSRDTLLRFEADPQAGYQYPFYLWIPGTCVKKDSHYLLVESNNTGTANDDFSVHDEAARVQAQMGPLGHELAKELKMPYLVPVFPRPEKQYKIYTHMLDRDAMRVKKGPMARIDLQLMAMIRKAVEMLRSKKYVMYDKIIMSGYSSSGVFANRFACLHPSIVKAYSAGGINGLVMMPFAKWNAIKLNYPLGTADFELVTASVFQLAAFQQIDQFLYMGEQDTNDAVLFDDGYDKKERGIVFKAFGEKMMPDRWFACQMPYKASSHNIQFRTYSGVGHAVNADILRDLVVFYEKSTLSN